MLRSDRTTGCGQRAFQPFVGRQEVLDLLCRALGEAARGRGMLTVLVGEAGIGKTRTALEFATRARGSGAQVRWGTCYEGEPTAPYGPWVEVLRGCIDDPASRAAAARMTFGAAEVGGIVPELRVKLPGMRAPRLPAAENRLRMFDGLIGLLAAFSAEKPLVVILDNLQWADPSSLEFLEHLSVDMARSPMHLFVLGSYREDDVAREHPLWRCLGELVKHPGFARVHLHGLARLDVGNYLAGILGVHPADGMTERLHQRTGGNPLFLVEVVREILERGQEDGWETVVPDGIRQAIARRMNRFPAECLPVLTMAAVLGRTFDLGLLHRMLPGMPEGLVLECLDRAAAGRIVEEVPEVAGRYRFTHVLMQESLLDELPAARQARLHGEVAQFMEEEYGTGSIRAGELVRHLAEAAGELGTEKLVRWTATAAEQALSSFAPDEALRLVDQALAVRGRQDVASTGSDAATALLLFLRGRALDGAGRAGAAESLEQAFDLYLRLGDTDHAVEVARTPVHVTMRVGVFETLVWVPAGAASLQRRALDLVRPGSIEEGWLLFNLPDGNGTEKALVIAREEGDAALEMWALAVMSQRHASEGHFARSAEEGARAIELAERTGDRAAFHYCQYYGNIRRRTTGADREAQDSAHAMLRNAIQAGSRRMLCEAHQQVAVNACLKGAWGACREHAEANLSMKLGRVPAWTHITSLGALAMMEFETGSFEAAEHHLGAIGSLCESPEVPLPFAAARIARITGDARRLDAAEAVVRQVPFRPQAPFNWWQMARWAAMALTAVVREDPEAVEESLETAGPRKGCFMATGAWGACADGLRGLLLAARGSFDEATACFDDALAFCRAAGLRPGLAWTCCDCAETLARRDAPGDRRRLEALLDEGRTIAQELGMRPLRARIERCLRKVSGGLERKASYPDGLTEREVEVLRLVARGLTNQEIGERLFISQRTVARHMQNALGKTGMANRAEITAFAFREGLLER